MNYFSTSSAIIATLACATCFAPVHANPTVESTVSPYVGGAIGTTGAATIGSASALSASPVKSGEQGTGFKLYGGYQLHQNFGVEAGVIRSTSLKRTFGISGQSITQVGKPSAVYLAGTGRLDLTDQVALSGKLGIAKSEFAGANVLPVSSSLVGKKTGAIIGVGVDYRVAKNVIVTADYDFLPRTSANLKTAFITLGLKVGF